MILYIILILVLVSSFTGTFLFRRFALNKSIIDLPNNRSSHLDPTPRGGGLAIVISWFIGLSLLFYLGQIPINLFLALLSGIFLAVISLFDDFKSLPPKIRLLFQIISVLCALFFIGNFGIIDLGFYSISNYLIIYPLVFVGFLWFINLFNFMDGTDAYASMQAIIVGLGLFIIIGSNVLLVLVFSVLGFLIWNWPKAKIFMGDIGSTQLGFVLFVLALYYNKIGDLSFINWIVLNSLFLFDATYTLFRRWRNNERLSTPHKSHAYQRLVQYGFSHQKVVLIAIVINLALFSIVLFLKENYLVIQVLISIFINLVYYWFVDSKMPFKYIKR